MSQVACGKIELDGPSEVGTEKEMINDPRNHQRKHPQENRKDRRRAGVKPKTSPATSIPCKTGHINNDLGNKGDQMSKDPQMLEKYARVAPGKCPQRNGSTPKRSQGPGNGQRRSSQSIVPRFGQQRESKRKTMRTGLLGSPLQDRVRIFPVKGARDALRDLGTGIRTADG